MSNTAPTKTRALFRPKPERAELHPLSQLIVDELAAQQDPGLHSYDYDACGYFSEQSYDPIYGAPGPRGDNWGNSLPAPTQAPVSARRGWHDRR